LVGLARANIARLYGMVTSRATGLAAPADLDQSNRAET
jgi:hypothetical protein